MRNYIPNTQDEQAEMLSATGISSINDLFADIPAAIRYGEPLDLPEALSEYELTEHLKALSAQNVSADSHICFMGGGVYDHFIPAAVNRIISRQEFLTAYTPYQAEISQGTLQAIFEYQTMICRLTGMDVSNASVYDGATACAEAMLMAHNINNRLTVIICGAVNSEYVKVCKTYARFRDIEIIDVPFNTETGACDLARLQDSVNSGTSAVIVQNPNFFGCLEDLEAIGKIAKDGGAIFITACDPISLALLEPPAEYGADIAVGEGQALGNPMNFGGPGLGFMTCKSEYARKLPGRIVGATTDSNGERGFVLTIQAREQHIRREKATSNICSNQALCALAATVYMSLMGKEGLAETAELCYSKAHYMYDRLIESGKFTPVFNAPFFKEFTVKYNGGSLGSMLNEMLGAGFMAGIDISYRTGLSDSLLIAVTEKRTKPQIDAYVRKAGELA